MTILYILAALLMLGIMVTVHEAGHFFAARICKIPVKQFAIGFGPKIVEWKSKKHETLFSLRLIPAGGFCMFYGEDQVEGFDKKDTRNLNNFAVLKRMFVVVMGPIMNFVLAFLICFSFYLVSGVEKVEYGYVQINSVEENSPAQAGGVLTGDIITAVNGQDTFGLQDEKNTKTGAFINTFKKQDVPLDITVKRGEEEVQLQVVPKADASGELKLGITFKPLIDKQEIVHLNVFESISASYQMCVYQGGAILGALKNLIFKGEGLNQMAGPVGVVSIVAEQTKTYGFSAYLSLMVMISVNLGLVNLLPIPGLDGSRLVFLLIEGIRKKPISQKVEAYIHMAGFMVFILLFILLTWQDIVRMFK